MAPLVLAGDPGIDDAVAWAFVASASGRDVTAVVAGMGNVAAVTAWRNALGLVSLLGLDVPVGIGAATALDGSPSPRAGDPVHGPDGLAGEGHRLRAPAGSPAIGGPLLRGTVLATGPLTDVALALRAGQPVERVVWMGGALDGGNVTPVAEFNAWADPLAVDEVLTAGIDLAVVPLDVTRRIRLTAADVGRWSAGPPVARFCARLGAYRMADGAAPLHDPVAAVALVEPQHFGWERLALRCVTGGADRGALAVTVGAPEVSVATTIDVAAVHHRIVTAVAGDG